MNQITAQPGLALMRSIKLHTTLATILLLVLVQIAPVQAEETSFHISRNFSECDRSFRNFNQTYTEYADFRYDSIEKKLYIEVGLSGVANGFHFGINSEGHTTNNDYKYAYFYVDGRNLLSGNTPRLNAFIFNRDSGPSNTQTSSSCNNNPGSWNTNADPERRTEAIFPGTSGYRGNPSWVELATVSNTTVNGVATRAFSIVIDANQIQSFVPNSSFDFLQTGQVLCGFGIQRCPNQNQAGRILDFGNPLSNRRISIEYVAANITSASYNFFGQLTNFQTSNCSECVINGDTTNVSPTCSRVDVAAEEIRAGEVQEISFDFIDPDRFDQLTLNYTGLPSAATASPSQNGIIGVNEAKTATITWTPTDADVGTQTISAQVIQDYGHFQTASNLSECSASFTVLESLQPVCEEQAIGGHISQATESLAILNEVLLRANRQLIRFENRLNQKRRRDFSDLINQHNSDISSLLAAVPTPLLSCSNHFESCSQNDFGRDYQRILNTVPQLYCDGTSIQACNFLGNVGEDLFRLWRRRFIKFLRTERGLTRRAARTRANRRLERQFTTVASLHSANAYDNVVKLITDFDTVHFTCN